MTDLTTYSAALAQMGALAQSSWGALGLANPDVAEMRFPETELTFGKAKLDKYWSRFSTINASGAKTSVGSLINSKARYTYNGILYIQIFAGMFILNGPDVARGLAEEMRNAFRSPQQDGSVIYRNARIDELTNDGTFFQYRVIVEYEFDELG